MADYEELLERYASQARQALPPITRDLLFDLGFYEDQTEVVEKIGDALARAYIAGVNAGEAEVMAQAAEQGFQVNVKQLRAPRDA